jgi:hypothetical protein
MIFKQNRLLLFWLVLLATLLLSAVQYVTPLAQHQPDIMINELLAANKNGLTDEDGDYSDWIEIYNPGRRPVNLSGWSLTDDRDQLQKWAFPDIVLGSQQYLVIFASGKDRRHPGSNLHTNFKLRASGEFLALTNMLDDSQLDVIKPQFPQQFKNVAYGRVRQTAAYRYLARPTPGEVNDESLTWQDKVSGVRFSRERGFYDSPLALELASDTPGAVIRYTIDGSEPTDSHGFTYTNPIPVKATTLLRAAAFKADFLPSPVNTHTYIFPDDVLSQPANPAGFPSTWGIYTKAYDDGPQYEVGTPVTADYEMDPEIVNDPYYGKVMIEALTSLPSLSIVTDMEHFVDLYANPQQRGLAWERPVSVELLYPDGDQNSFQIDAGLRIQGGVGRREYIPKHSFRLFFREKYGAAKLKHALFSDSSIDAIDTLILRGGVNRSYAGKGPVRDEIEYYRLTTYTRDEWLRSSQNAVSGLSAHGLFVHLYLNGLYWGLYNLVERPDASFTSAYLGGQKEAWYAVNHSGPISGASDRFDALKGLIGEESEAVKSEDYLKIQHYLDIPQFIDFLILNFYAGNDDWADNNWYAGVQNPDGKVQYFVWDGENTWKDGPKIVLGQKYRWGHRNLLRPLVSSLILNPEFKIAFFDRLYKHLFNDGALTDANSQARWLEINQQIEQAIIAESGRWGDVRYAAPITQEDWLRARDDVMDQMEGQAERVIAVARGAGYPAFDPPVFNLPGGLVEYGFRLTMTADAGFARQGTIYYTTDHSDPREPFTGAITPSAAVFQQSLEITRTTHVKARLLVDDTWSALNEATFSVIEADSKLRITEIMYNPTAGSDYEFIELKNCSQVPIDLSNMTFEGIEFTFPPATNLLGPRQLVVLVSNPQAFARRYPDTVFAGVYDKRLSNSGETITLRDTANRIITSVTYDDEQGWPISPDGHGDSLVLVKPEGDPNEPQSWRASVQLHGSPGSDDSSTSDRNTLDYAN